MNITPEDVYGQIRQLQSTVSVLRVTVVMLACLVVLQIVAKFVLFGKMWSIGARVAGMLDIMEAHARINDDQKAQVSRKLDVTTKEVMDEVKRVPDVTIEKLKEKEAGDSEHALRFRAMDSGPHNKGGGD